MDLAGKPWPKWMSAEECQVAYAKFALLIVQECVNIADKAEPYMASDLIKQQFGIE